jgi:DNA-binding LytR/AlgR family response regulator
MESVVIKSKKESFSGIREIVYLKSIGDFITSYLMNGKEGLVEYDLECIQSKLPNHKFFRISDSFIINIDFLKKIRVNSNKNVLMHGGIELVMDLSKYQDLTWFLRNRYCI